MTHDAISFPARCIHCHHPIESPVVCDTCNALQPLGPDQDAFALLQLPPRYRIDSDKLDRNYLAVSRQIHPDYFGRGDGQEHALSQELSARVNDAYRTLKDPLLRSEYLLSRAGGRSATEDKRVSPELLAEVLSLREEIEDAKRAKERELLERLNARLRQRQQEALDRLAGLHGQLEEGQLAGDGTRVDRARREIRLALNGVRYIAGLIRESNQ